MSRAAVADNFAPPYPSTAPHHHDLTLSPYSDPNNWHRSSPMDSTGTPTSSPSLAYLLRLSRGDDDNSTPPPPPSNPRHHDATAIHMNDGISLPPVPFLLRFSNLTYCVKVRREKNISKYSTTNGAAVDPELPPDKTRTLLNDISGEARDGEILGVLGASGSGKSTLIDALANRIAKGSLKGSVTLNGERLESSMLRVISAYVMQDDLLFPMLTVEETLTFAAEFRLPRSLSSSKKKARVQQLIDQLGLRTAAKTVIGDEGHRGVSGGERRRVSIGIDIVHDPILLFLDEPTSGLDSTSAYMVIKVLRRIALSGSVVIMSVHQPSYRILGLLDRLLFLSHGSTVYSGSPSGLFPFFSEFGHRIPDNENPSEFALDLIRELQDSPDGTKALVQFNCQWQCRMTMTMIGSQQTGSARHQDSQGRSLKESISLSISRGKLAPIAGGSPASASLSSLVPAYANPFWVELLVLSRRSIKNSLRMPELFGIRLAAVLVTGFILATVFWRLDDTPKGIQERIGFFAFAMSTTFYTTADALPVFIQERYIFMRETAYNAYRRSSYVVSHAITCFPALVLLAFALSATTFFSVGLSGGVQGFLFYSGVMLASFWAGNSFVSFLSGIIPHVMIGYVVVVAVLAYFLLFSGFFINRDRIPDYWIWFHYISLVKYPYEAVLQNEFQDPGKCFVRGVQIFDTTPLATVSAAVKEKLLGSISDVVGVPITPETCVTYAPAVLENQNVADLDKWSCLYVTIAWGFLFRILFYFALLFFTKNKRS